MDSDDGLPVPPPATIEYRALIERWSEVVDWCQEANGKAAFDRSYAFHNAMLIEDHKKRSNFIKKSERQYFDRLLEIEKVEEIYKQAFEDAKASLNRDELLEYACLIRPLIYERDQLEAQKLGPKWKRILEQKEAKMQAYEERKAARTAKKLGRHSGKIERGNRNLPEPDRTSTVVDEGAGDRSVTTDRGNIDSSRWNEDGGTTRRQGSSPPQNDRIESEIGRIDSEGTTEQGL